MHSEYPPTLPAEYADIEFENNAQRLPLVLCLDTSSSMAGAPIQSLNDALAEWTRELHDDVSLSYSVEVAVITFGGRGVGAWRGPQLLDPRAPLSPFVPAHAFQAPRFTASGVTLMTEALELAMHVVAARKAELRASGLQYYRPQICLVTDGLPTDATGHMTDSWHRLLPVLAEEQQARRFRLYAIGVGGITDRGEQVLQAFAPKFNARIQGFPFRELLQMMSASANAEQKGAGDEVFEKIFSQFKTQRPAWES
ncbi:VWA domain-containing protein [Streptomyces sp. NBC_01478]|uniref:vWA domain-containing protein n=1 Tax=Streptomyces sp. NBC_01478 TaxID=2903882 RepID=UPI002E32A394|nr:VWA domain-containing protein [Streptomyces sp. NBC_01478]